MWDEKEASLFQFYINRALFDTELLSKHEEGSVPQKQLRRSRGFVRGLHTFREFS